MLELVGFVNLEIFGILLTILGLVDVWSVVWIDPTLNTNILTGCKRRVSADLNQLIEPQFFETVITLRNDAHKSMIQPPNRYPSTEMK